MPSKIEWLNKLPGFQGETWNPVTGCQKVSAGCKNCYAEGNAVRFWGKRKFTDVMSHKDRLNTPLHWKKPRLIFVNSMSDLFHEDVSFEFIHQVYINMMVSTQHIFIILTKREKRALEYYEWMAKNGYQLDMMPHVWFGVSVEDQPSADSRIPVLLQIPASKRIVSYEPAIGGVDLAKYMWPTCWKYPAKYKSLRDAIAAGAAEKVPQGLVVAGLKFLDWVIFGGESGHGARPMHPDWARKVRDDCKAAGVPLFFKQWGEYLPHCQVTTLETFETSASMNSARLFPSPHNPDKMNTYYKLGKKHTGRLLDGEEYSEYPVNGLQ